MIQPEAAFAAATVSERSGVSPHHAKLNHSDAVKGGRMFTVTTKMASEDQHWCRKYASAFCKIVPRETL